MVVVVVVCSNAMMVIQKHSAKVWTCFFLAVYTLCSSDLRWWSWRYRQGMVKVKDEWFFWPYKITLTFCIEDELENDDMYLSNWIYNVYALYALWKFFSYNFLLNRIICTFIFFTSLFANTDLFCSRKKIDDEEKSLCTVPCCYISFFCKVVFIAQMSTSIYRFFMNSLFLHDCHSHDTHIINIYSVEIVCPFLHTVKWKKNVYFIKREHCSPRKQ